MSGRSGGSAGSRDRAGGAAAAPRSSEVTPMPVTTSREHCRCLEKNWGGLELPHQDGTQATDLERGTHACARIPWDSQRAQGWDLVQDLGDPRCSLSFLSEDITEDIAGPLSSTRRSLQEEPDLGGDCSLGDPLPLSIASRAPWPHADPGGSAVPPQPLASSTLLAAGDVLSEGPQRQIVGGRRRGPPWGLPRPSPQQSFGPRGSPRPPQPQCHRRVWGGREASPQAPLLRGGCGPRDGDIPGARARLHAGAPQGLSVGWAGLGVPVLAVPTPGSGVRDTSSAGDTSGTSECFFSALETLEPSEAGGCQGAQHPRSPQPRAVVGPELGEAPSPPGAAALVLPLDSPPSAERVQRGGLRGGSRAAPCSEDELGVSGVGGLLVQLKGCSLRETPPHTAEPPSSPAILAAGDAPPEGPEPPRYLHVTPRTKRRLQASAARLGVSSSSSLFEETLEMPRRPPRVRAPWGVPRDPPTAVGLCIASGGEEVASGDGEGTGSMDDTEILPGDPNQPSSPRATSSSPGSSPTILLVPGDHGHPQDIPSDARGSSPTVLLVPGDHGHPQDIPSDARGSSPTVLLVPGDHGHPQDIPSDAQGSSPTVLLVPGDHGHPQEIPSNAQGCPHGTGSHRPGLLEDVSWWQDPSPLGTRLGHLLAPRPPRSPVVEPGSPATLSSPTGHGTHRAGEQLQDEEQGPAPTEPHSPGTEATASPEDTTVEDSRACPARPRPLSDEGLRRRLRALGDDPGPITDLTRRLYLRRLEKLVRRRQRTAGGHSPELVAALRSGRIPDCAQDELVLAQQFDHPDRNRHWREGLVKSSFNYLLLDPRTTQNLPLRSHRLSSAECFRTFIKAIFYVGKGTRARPYCHLAEALSQHRAGKQEGCPKVRRILEIWASGQGVISVHCFQNTIPAEAYTRESCLVEALGLWAITNQRKGNCYGAVASWPAERRRRLGVHMLHRVMRIFLAEGERQLRPSDIQGGR